MTPAFAAIEESAAGWQLETRPLVAAWCRRAMWGLLVVVPATAVGMGVAADAIDGPHRPAAVTAIILGGFTLAVSAVFALVRFAAAVVRCRAVFDGRTLTLQGGGGPCAIPVGDVLGVAVHVDDARYTDFDLSGSPWAVISRRQARGVDVSVPGGRIRAFANRDPVELEWLAAELRDRLGRPADVSDRGVPVARLGRLTAGARWAVLTVGLGLGLGMLVPGTWTFALAVGSRHWPTVAGVVVHAAYEDHGDTYTQELTYTYRVGGRTFTSTDIGFLRDNGEAAVASLIRGHVQGTGITVYYQPGNPARSVVLPGPGSILWFILAGGLLMLFFSLPLCFHWPGMAESALARRYAMGLPASVTLDAITLHRWFPPTDLWEQDRRSARQTLRKMAVRSTALTGVGVWGLWWWARPYVTNLPAGRMHCILWGMTVMPGLLFGLESLGFGSKRTPGELRLTAAGVRLPRSERPLLKWERFTSYTVETHPRLADRRWLILHHQKRCLLRLALPSSPLSDQIVATVAEHLAGGSDGNGQVEV